MRLPLGVPLHGENWRAIDIGGDRFDNAIRQSGANARATASQLAADIIAVFRALPGQMLELGSQIIQGLWDGLKSKYEAVKASVSGFASDLVGGVKSTLGIQSPSTVMFGVGENMMEGLGNGMSSMQSELGSLVQSIGQTISGGFSKMVDGLIAGTLNIREAISGLLGDLAKLLINHAFKALLGGIGGGGGGLLGGLFGGFFAGGGRIPAGQYGIVGEMGPELIRGPAAVTPMEMVKVDDDGGGGGGAGSQGDVHLKNVNLFDASDMLSKALGTRAGERVILNFINQNRGAVQGALNGR